LTIGFNPCVALCFRGWFQGLVLLLLLLLLPLLLLLFLLRFLPLLLLSSC
jgi:hypothetical protein